MSLDLTEFTADIAEAIDDVPTPWVDGLVTFNVLSSTPDRKQTVQPGGLLGSVKISCLVNNASLPVGYSVPSIGHKVSVGGTEYRILEKEVGIGGTFQVIHLGDPYEKR